MLPVPLTSALTRIDPQARQVTCLARAKFVTTRKVEIARRICDRPYFEQQLRRPAGHDLLCFTTLLLLLLVLKEHEAEEAVRCSLSYIIKCRNTLWSRSLELMRCFVLQLTTLTQDNTPLKTSHRCEEASMASLTEYCTVR